MQEFLNTTINGLSSGAIYALGAIGLSLVYGILKLVNFAHGDFMTLGGFVAFAVNVSAGMPLAVAVLAAVAAVAALGLVLEYSVWAPMRRKGAGVMQLLLLSIGLAFVLRNLILFQWTGATRTLDVDQFQSWNPFGDVIITRIQVIVIVTAGVVLIAVALMLRTTLIGKSMRALSDSFDLAEVSGVNTRRVVAYTWLLAGSLAGLAGVLAAVYTTLTPNTGWFLLLSIFAAVVLGGIGNAYGALLGGIVLGLAQEWSTMLIRPTYKEAIGFLVLILVLLVRPQGILGQARTV
ncbi:branched-chain amino acid ABC transporter permease [Miltoncostaea marina]|uniref:branched-chain amino acid ABC transporter permease n=1 Tax=Miltoncostaea marina TaxID=2843215 RepID=UPI001C3D899E|nr:branched-chain amino acid ABC transporter permease [Miltoncostaea marina]